MKLDKDGNLIHENFTKSFEYKGRTFILDEHKDFSGRPFWLASESQMLIKAYGKTEEEAVENVKEKWDEVEHKYNK